MYDNGDFYSVKDKMREGRGFETMYSRLYKAKMERLARNMFKWESSEPHVTGDLIERYLWADGKALVWKHPMLGWIVTRCSETAWNVNGYAVAWKPLADMKVEGIEFPDEVFDTDAVCIYEWAERYIQRKACLFLCDEMADINETIRQQVWNQKTPLLAITGTTQKRDKIRNMIVRIAQNINVLFMDSDIADDVKPLDLNAPFNVLDLHQHKKYVENEMLDWLGIDQMDANPKKERMIVDEQEANDESLNYTLADMLNERLRACDRLAKLGLDITVEVQRSVRPEDDNMDGDPEQPNDEVENNAD